MTIDSTVEQPASPEHRRRWRATWASRNKAQTLGATTDIPRPGQAKKKLSTPARLGWQAAFAATFLLAWEYLPKIDWISSRFKFLNEFFISSPSAVTSRISDLATGNNPNEITLWPYLGTTVWAAVAGVTIGLAIGAFAGLVFSNSRRLSDVFRPFIVLANTIPRIALIPIFIVIYGPTVKTSILSVVAVVFFLAFFNAFEGGCSVRQPIIDNALLLGASPRAIMRTIRLPQVLVWTFAIVPNAIAFGVVVATTTELLTGINGMGTLLQESLLLADSTLTFSVIVVMSMVGLVLYLLTTKLRDLVMRWEEANDDPTISFKRGIDHAALRI